MIMESHLDSLEDSDDEIVKTKPRRLILSSDDEAETTSNCEFTVEKSEPNLQHLQGQLASNSNTNLDFPSKSIEDNENINIDTRKKKRNLKSTLLNESDFESSDNENECRNNYFPQDTFKNDDINSKEENKECLGPKGKNQKEKNKKKLKCDPKFEIYSESARMTRESSVSLPYHKPKQRTLKEFLSRKKGQLPAAALRIVSSDIISTLKEIDKSTKDAIEFFKSDSENEEESNENHFFKDISLSKDTSQKNGENSKNECEKDSIEESKIQSDKSDSDSILKNDSSLTTIQTNVNVIENKLLNEKEHSKTVAIERTESWLEEIRTYEKKENKIKKFNLDPSILSETPTLSHETDTLIDLDNFSPKKHTNLKPGAKALMDRLFNNWNLREIKSDDCPASIESKPITKLYELQSTLKKQMELKSEEDFQRRIAEEAKEKVGFEEQVDQEAEDEEEEEEEDLSESDAESEPEENDIDMKDKPRKSCAFADSEAEESENNDEDSDNDESQLENDDENLDNESEDIDEKYVENEKDGTNDDTAEGDDDEDSPLSLIPAAQPEPNRQPHEIPLTQTQLSLPLPLPEISPLSLRSPLRDITPNQLDDVPPTPSPMSYEHCNARRNLFTSQPLYEKQISPSAEDDAFAFVSGVFPSNCDDGQKNNTPLNASEEQGKDQCNLGQEERGGDSNSDEEDKEKSTVIDENDLFEMPLARKKRKARLSFSDDEDETNEEVEENSEVEEEKQQKSYDYDSEENEIEYDNDSDDEDKGSNINPAEFFENEAELSESEWSGDEDEKGLDRFDAEEGDKDVLDDNQVAEQLGKIHMRRMLDQDTREVRMIQELLLEDGDLHTDGRGRERKFRWQNLKGWGDNDNNEYNQNDIDEDETDEGFKLRHEKLQFLLEIEKTSNKLDNEPNQSDSLLSRGMKILQKVQIKTTQKQQTMTPVGCDRGPLLSRSENFISRLANITSSSNEFLQPQNSSKFLFKTKSPEKSATLVNCKRKGSSCREVAKRVRLDPSNPQEPIMDA